MSAKRARIAPGIFLFVAALATYLGMRSISLDDFDSFNFARAIDHFDVRLNQPHPPGYPVYVLLARLANLVLHDHLQALTILSACSGALAVLVFFFLAHDLDIPWAAVLLASMPLFWLSSEIALSDVPGLFFSILAVLLIERSVKLNNHLAPGHDLSLHLCAAGVITGLAAGVRPQDAIVPISTGLLYALPQFGKKWLKTLATIATGFLPACTSWAVPLLRSLGSLSQAMAVLAGQAAYVGATDSLYARPLTLSNLMIRFGEFGSVFSAYFGGPRDGGLLAFFALAGAIAILAFVCRRPPVRWLALAWLLPYAVFMLIALRPDDPRKVLPAIPPMLLLFVAAFAPDGRHSALSPQPSAIRQRSASRFALALPSLALAGLFIFSAWPLVRTLHTVKAPPVQAAEYIGNHFPRGNTLIVAGSSFNAVRYLLPGYTTYFLEAFDRTGFARDVTSGAYDRLILLDKEGPSVPETYVGTVSRVFRRDPLVLPKAAEVWMEVYRPVSVLSPPQFALPEGPLHIGTQEDIRYLLDGWHRPETIAGKPARWSASTSSVRFWIDQPKTSILRLVAVSFPAGQQLSVLVNGQLVTRLQESQDWAPYDVSLPAALFRSRAINVITLQHSKALSAFDATDGQSTDRRALAAAYSSFELIAK